MSEDTAAPGLYPADTIAKLLELTTRRLHQLADQGYIPKAQKGKYPLAPCVQGYIRFLKASRSRVDGAEDGDDGDVSYRREKALLTRAQRRMAEIEVDTKAGELIPASEVETEMAAIVKTFVGFLEQIPDILERDANISGDAVERLQEIVDRERERLYQQMTA